MSIDKKDPKNYITIQNAQVNNLKNLSISLKRNQLIVITGVSGSGKSSLAFDTLFAEGQRTYIESLSTYTRQFLGKYKKPKVQSIQGLSPAIAIQQKNQIKSSRSTVGTITEIYDYCKLLFAKIGQTYSPISQEKVKKHTVNDVLQYLYTLPTHTTLYILAPIDQPKTVQELTVVLQIALRKGFTRLWIQEQFFFIEDILQENLFSILSQEIYLLIDRMKLDINHQTARLQENISLAFQESKGYCTIYTNHTKEKKIFSNRFFLDGLTFEVPTVHFFGFNNAYGACPTCKGMGNIVDIDPLKVIPKQNLSIFEGAIVPWNTATMKVWLVNFLEKSIAYNFPIHRPYQALTAAEKKMVWQGHQDCKGIEDFFQYLHKRSHKIQYRVLAARYKGKTPCKDCQGTRIRKDTSYVKIGQKSIGDLLCMSIQSLLSFFETLEITAQERKITQRIITEIQHRLAYLSKVGLDYLTLARDTSTLSGGEFQRIKLANALGSTLVDTLYILDEPTIGLHPKDTTKLAQVLVDLKNKGNTVIVVEHEEAVMQIADQIVDIGPTAGKNGGYLIYQGTLENFKNCQESYTARYLHALEKIDTPLKRRKWHQSIHIKNVRANNLRHIDVQIPLGVLTLITGVSGSGKSTLIIKTIYPALEKAIKYNLAPASNGFFDSLTGDYQNIDSIEWVDQNPLGKSSRSNPITYLKAYDNIRKLLAQQPLAIEKKYTAAYFSFNIKGGRCEKCQGEGILNIQMQFLPDIQVICDQCQGRRFQKNILHIRWKGKNIEEILKMTVDEALLFFKDEKKIYEKLLPLQAVGMGYIQLGTPSNSLSGGEAQRIKLAAHLAQKDRKENILFIFDEPTTGLHFHDIKKLLSSIQALIDQGHSVWVIEHNLDMIKSADWIIDLGPEGGKKGGEVLFNGTPEAMLSLENNHTAKYLNDKI